MNIAFCGGGTGGHVFPIKSLIECIYKDTDFSRKFNKIFWIGQSNGLEKKIFDQMDIPGVHFLSILSGKIRRERSLSALFKNIFDLFFVIIGIFQSIYFLIKNDIDVIFCKGGFVAVPVVIAGRILRRKIFLHESDTVPGLANKLAAKFSNIRYCGFPEVFPGCRHVGQILSSQLLDFEKIDVSHLDMSRPNVLLIGGSQGSQTIYENIYKVYQKDKGLFDSFNFFLILGTQNVGLKNKFNNFKNVITFDFVSQRQIGYLYSLCDIGITRGGATSLAEQKAFGMKLIIIPLPYTGGNHQYYNGLYYSKYFDDTLILQDNELYPNLIQSLKNSVGYKKPQIDKVDIDGPTRFILQDIISNV